ncbi:hypothetical protein X915_gp027 [Bacillus phage vB_BanS-Tsamsa]|uniref:Uncharacterized protein n=1 Tax=Bacillus phage vB_BanS-Tsamsa TaxID=1308863 RepID=U5J9U3_9CAUD|nr:hypothetical protein X915_gp027 [Bacillus phage vB_BanS-Tsamsa]AGI11991.1 hypothetical protein [Bacillus phage vB_BanS-Tsamsa]
MFYTDSLTFDLIMTVGVLIIGLLMFYILFKL